MSQTIQIKRASGVPAVADLLEGELAFSLDGGKLYIGGSGGSAVQQIGSEKYQSSVLDSVTAPSSSVEGDRFLVTATATGVFAGEEGTIAEYDGAAWSFTSASEGMMTWDEAAGALYVYDGATWNDINLDTSVDIQEAFNNLTPNAGPSGKAIYVDAVDDYGFLVAATDVASTSTAFTVTGQNHTGAEQNALFTNQGATLSTSIATFRGVTGQSQNIGYFENPADASGYSLTGADAAVIWSRQNNTTEDIPSIFATQLGDHAVITLDQQGDGAHIEFGSAISDPTISGAGELWYGTGNIFKYDDGTANRTIANLEADQTFSGDLTVSAGINLTSTTGGVYTVSSESITAATSITNKEYVDSVAAGLDPKASGDLIEAVSNIANTQAGAGVGATLTTVLTTLDIDSVTLTNGMRVVINAQTNKSENGIYDVSGVGSAIVFTRSDDFDGDPAAEIDGGEFVFVTQGATYADTGWVVSTPNATITVDTNDIEFTQFSAAGVINAGVGIRKDGSNFHLDISEMTTGTVTKATDYLWFGDISGTATNEKTTVDSFLTTLNLNTTSDATLGSVNGLSLTENVDGFSIAGGSSDERTFTLDNGDLSVDINAGLAAGQVLIYDATSGSFENATLTAGDGIDITNADGSITVLADLKANGGLVIESGEIALDLGASSITGTLAVSDGGTGLTTIAQGSVLLANTADTLTAVDGSSASAMTAADQGGVLMYDSTNDVIAWSTSIDGGSF